MMFDSDHEGGKPMPRHWIDIRTLLQQGFADSERAGLGCCEKGGQVLNTD